MDPVYRQKQLFTACRTCVFRNTCDEPVGACPPLRAHRGRVDTRMISPINPRVWDWIRSVGGNLDLDIAFPEVTLPKLPTVIPAIPQRLTGPQAHVPFVGITLSRVLTSQGALRYATRERLLQAYGINPDSQLMLICVEKDAPLEHLWHNLDQRLADTLANFGFKAAIAPNFSVFLERSPLEHAVNYKRALIVAERLGRAGLPIVPHLYAAGPRALSRAITWLRDNPHITTISREVQTSKTDHIFHDAIATTKALVEGAGRPMHVIFVGPRTEARLKPIVENFPHFSIVQANGAALAANRRQLISRDGRLTIQHERAAVPTETFERNSRMIEHAVEHLRLTYAHELVPLAAATPAPTSARSPSLSRQGGVRHDK